MNIDDHFAGILICSGKGNISCVEYHLLKKPDSNSISPVLAPYTHHFLSDNSISQDNTALILLETLHRILYPHILHVPSYNSRELLGRVQVVNKLVLGRLQKKMSNLGFWLTLR